MESEFKTEVLNKAMELCREFEGLHDVRQDGLVYPYYCPAGKPTIGWGTLLDTIAVKPITKERADQLLKDELEKKYIQLLVMSPTLKTESVNRVAALLDFCYNLGTKAYATSTLKKHVDAGDWEAAKVQIVRWVYGGSKVLPGLVRRRNTERQLL